MRRSDHRPRRPTHGSLSSVDEDQAPPFSISIDAGMLGGVWANFAQVSHSPYEFTLDFVRLDFSQQPPTGIVVSRVSMSPLFVRQLIDALSQNWDDFAKKSLPKEVYEDGGTTEGE
jgi:hypothetical protein